MKRSQKTTTKNFAKAKGPQSAKTGKPSPGLAQPNLRHFLPPHFAVLCNEEESQFDQLFEDMVAVYQPANPVAWHVVRDIAVARWQILRIDSCLTNHWNLAIIESAKLPLSVAPELAEVQTVDRATLAMFAPSNLGRQLVRMTDSLTVRISRLERNLRFLDKNFGTRVIEPGPAKRRERGKAEPKPEKPSSTAPPEPSLADSSECEPPPVTAPNPDQPIFITENKPSVIAYYRQRFPGRTIVVLPADDVARGVDVEDHLPDIPRRVA